MDLKEICKRLSIAKKNYRASIRWYREVLGYRATVSGDVWKEEGQWLSDDAEFAYDEVVEDISRYRKRINFWVKMESMII